MRILVHLQPKFPETVEGEFFKFSEKPQHYIADTLFNTSTIKIVQFQVVATTLGVHLYLMVDVERREEK